MKYLNLVYPERSDVKFTIQKFPDGQQNVLIDENSIISDDIGVISRMNNWKDVELIAATAACLKEMEIDRMGLIVPYFLGSRSDRKFENGGNNYLKDVICPFINSLGFKRVAVLDPHSDVLEACLNNFIKQGNGQLVEWAIRDILVSNPDIHIVDTAIMVPDGGALKKIQDTVIEAKYEEKLIVCHKHRDIKTGKLLGFEVPIKEEDVNKTLIWVDDICDGGGSFIGEAQEANKQGHKGKKFLIVTHGIFSQGFKELAENFDGIYCTNSYSSIGDYAGNDLEKTKVKQKDIF